MLPAVEGFFQVTHQVKTGHGGLEVRGDTLQPSAATIDSS